MDDLLELRVMLPSTIVAELQARAATEHARLDTLVLEAVEEYLHDSEDTETDLIYANIREGIRQVQHGEVLPAMETLDAIEREFGDEQN